MSFKDSEFTFQRPNHVQKLLDFDHALGERRELSLERVGLRDHGVLKLYLGADSMF